MSKSRRLLLPLLCLALAAAGARASELGDTRVLSRVGQPLQAEVELTGVTALEAARLAVRPASADIYKQARVRPDPALDTLKLSVEQRGGQTWVRATSATPVDAPYIHVFLEIPSGSQHAVRALTFWLNPALPAPAPVVAAKARAAPRTRAVPAESLAKAAPAALPAAAAVAADAPRVTPAVLRRDAADKPAVAAPRPLEPQMMVAAAAAQPVAVSTHPAAPAAETLSTRKAPTPAPGVVSTRTPAAGTVSTHAPPAPAPGVISTRPPAAVAPAVVAHAPAPAAHKPDIAPAHAAPAAVLPVAAAAVPRRLSKAEAATCAATVQKMGERLSQCAATQVENERIAAQLVELESRVALLKRALDKGAAAKPASGRQWIWTIAVPAAIALFAMAGAAWFAFGRKGRRASDKRRSRGKGKASRKVEPSIDEAPEASAAEAADAAVQAAEEKAAVQGMVAKVRAMLGKMPTRRKKAAIEAAEPEVLTEEA